MAHALAELELFRLTEGLKARMYADNSRGVYDLIDDICILKSPALEVIYVQPREHCDDTPDDKHHYIYFHEFAEIVESQGDMGGLFAGYLRKWIEDPAKQPPDDRK